MSDTIPTNIGDLLRQRSVESMRIEFKAAWDADRTGPQILRTVCAFANDYQNLNGGYIVIGVGEQDGRAVLPPVGLDDDALDVAQNWLRGRCRALQPAYEPVFSPEVVDGRTVLVVWTPASASRPHRAPDRQDRWRYWIRIGASTVDAETHGQLEALLEQTARVPWDDRPANGARVEDLQIAIAREYLRDVGSALLGVPDASDVYRNMRLTSSRNDHEVPRNVGLLFFSEDPERWFPGARIEVVRFTADAAGNVLDERVFRGPLANQLRGCLRHLEGLSHAHLQKHRDRSQVRGWVSYPQVALREALVNAVYHRAYRPDIVEPTKVYLYPDRIEVISYPGPVAGVEAEHFENGRVPPIPPRNRRIGEYLKELKLAEGRLTGLPKMVDAMAKNGSPAPVFDFNPERNYFRATLPAHPEYAAISAIQDAAYLRTVGDADDAFQRVRTAWQANESSAVLAMEMIRIYAERALLDEARDVYERFRSCAPPYAHANVANVLMEALVTRGREREARNLVESLPDVASEPDAAVSVRGLHAQRAAHRYSFERPEGLDLRDRVGEEREQYEAERQPVDDVGGHAGTLQESDEGGDAEESA